MGWSSIDRGVVGHRVWDADVGADSGRLPVRQGEGNYVRHKRPHHSKRVGDRLPAIGGDASRGVAIDANQD
jgi:hypothetical protein